ncbi:MAG: ATP-dependent DNA helicase RecG [Phycisphaerae bacterium]|nr:ATP-dependent DNA helicase RecG [Phycisphaerae bacterium]
MGPAAADHASRQFRPATPHSPAPVAFKPQSPLDKPVQFVRGVGPQRARLLSKIGIQTVGDLIEYFPFRHEHQGRPQSVDSLVLDAHATVIGVVDSVRSSPARRGGPSVTLRLSDGTGTVRVAWFNAPYLRDRFQRGQVLRIHGQVGEFEGLGQFVNPTVEQLDPKASPKTWDFERVVPIYKATASLSTIHIARIVESALKEAISSITEPLPASLRQRRQLMGRQEAVRRMHHPDQPSQAVEARRRLAYDELFTMQLAISLQRRWTATRAQAPRLPVTPEIDRRIRRRFPFSLTAAQNKVISEISADLARDKPMTRLLQGDVGSGKTVVALYAALTAIANKTQCAILAPTEVLAAQHFAGIERYLAGSRVERCLLTGKTPKSQRDRLLASIAKGEINLIVGTQALLEKAVEFADLGLVIVDEQHKFGVSQRATMRGKKTAPRRGATTVVPHYLVMTATPIPRTLSMTVFGDLDISTIDSLPPGRQPIHTKIVRPEEEAGAWLAVRQRICEGDQVYVVYPLVEESDELDLKAATVEVGRVARDLLPNSKVGLLHGRMKNADKQAVMREFAAGRLDALVCTTVIEVGVDVPNATVMVVQHAERYGLAALHQLRGRVGRGSKASICLLMTDSPSGLATERLDILCRTTDGFRIAEEDLRLRGPGELLGTRQHGWPEFRVANLLEDADLLMQARDDAASLVREDPSLQNPVYAPLKADLRRRFRDKVAFIHVG